MKKKILFIDRDGTLINEPKNDFKIDSIEKISLEPHVIPSLLNLQKAHFQLIMITNQDKLGTNDFPQIQFDKSQNFLMKIFISQGIKFNKILICPHSPEENCECRKPKTKLITSWLTSDQINKKNSYVIGDRETDMMLAQNIGINGLLYNQNTFNWIDIVQKITKNNRFAESNRNTKESNINIKIWLDENHNDSYIDTNIKFFNHMLQQIAIHAGIKIYIKSINNMEINDDHHIIEDTALTLGEVLNIALNDKHGINRFGFVLPMDESTTHCILDISGRPYLKFNGKFNYQKIGDLSTEMIQHFFLSLSSTMKCTLHIKSTGTNDHHKAESIFKAFGQTLRQAIHIQHNYILSTKGLL